MLRTTILGKVVRFTWYAVSVPSTQTCIQSCLVCTRAQSPRGFHPQGADTLKSDVLSHRTVASCCGVAPLGLYRGCCCIAPTTPRAVGKTQMLTHEATLQSRSLVAASLGVCSQPHSALFKVAKAEAKIVFGLEMRVIALSSHKIKALHSKNGTPRCHILQVHVLFVASRRFSQSNSSVVDQTPCVP